MVSPAAARALMGVSWVLPAVSWNSAGGAGSRFRRRTRKEAIYARVTGVCGQKRSGRWVHPVVIPSAASCSTWAAHHASVSTSSNLASGGVWLLVALTSHTAKVPSFDSARRGICGQGRNRYLGGRLVLLGRPAPLRGCCLRRRRGWGSVPDRF